MKADQPYPFLGKAFLQALEDSQSACAETGWQPMHIKLDSASDKISMPLYLKDHSMGEYVFDYAWADAYYRHNLEYYPKLLTAIPFTPASGPRAALSSPLQARHCQQLFESVLVTAEETGASSWHMLFPDQQQLELFQDLPLLHREGVQYHWFNRDYATFDDFLGAMTSRKRKMIRRERKEISQQGISIEIQEGANIQPAVWQLFYYLYERTYAKRNGTRGYLTQQFFQQIASTMCDQIAMAVAYKDEQPIACALYFFDSHTLYGRYWGSVDEFQFLHFELCYYQGIEFALSKGLQKYDAGAQGEHKIMRGFEPIKTHSLHWIKHDDFRGAIQQFLTEEKRSIETYIENAKEILPYRQVATGQ